MLQPCCTDQTLKISRPFFEQQAFLEAYVASCAVADHGTFTHISQLSSMSMDAAMVVVSATYGVVDEVRYNGLHELLVATVADQGNQHLKQLTYQALKVHIVSIPVCLQTLARPHSCIHCRFVLQLATAMDVFLVRFAVHVATPGKTSDAAACTGDWHQPHYTCHCMQRCMGCDKGEPVGVLWWPWFCIGPGSCKAAVRQPDTQHNSKNNNHQHATTQCYLYMHTNENKTLTAAVTHGISGKQRLQERVPGQCRGQGCC